MFEQLVKVKFDGLSAGQKKVAEYMLQNLEKCSYDTIAKISRDTSVSETTVIRLSYALGFNSFSEMQRSVREQILGGGSAFTQPEADEAAEDSRSYGQTLERDMKILKQTLEQLEPEQIERAVELLVRADRVIVVGYRSAYSAAHWFATTLGLLRENVKLAALQGEVFEPLLSVTDETAVVAISFPRYAKETYKFVKAAKDRGASVVSVTDSKLSPVGCLSDYTMITQANRDETGFNSMSSAIGLLHLLAAGVRKRNHEAIKQRLQKLEELYSSYDILIE